MLLNSYAAEVRTRRAVLSGAAILAVAGLFLSGRADDLAHQLGVRPVPEVRDSDRVLLDRVINDQQHLLASARASGDDSTVAILLTQLTELGANAGNRNTVSVTTTKEWRSMLSDTAERREVEAMNAVAPEFAQVLASLAAGLAQASMVARVGEVEP